jgi:hypothetical protein
MGGYGYNVAQVSLAHQGTHHRDSLKWSERQVAKHDVRRNSSTFASTLQSDFRTLLTNGTGAYVHPQGLKIFLGILSSHNQAELRQVHRETWMLSPHVCRKSFTVNCAFRVNFVLHYAELPAGAEQQAMAAAEGHDDLMFLPANSVLKKKYVFLKAALESFPDATHLAKADLDTFVNADAFLRELLPVRGHNIFYGKFMSGQAFSRDRRPLALCHGEEEADLGSCCRPSPSCSIANGFDGKCWMGAQGALWLLSRRLAESSGLCLERMASTNCRNRLSDPSAWPHEDIDVGRCVGLALRGASPVNRSTFVLVNSEGLVFCRPRLAGSVMKAGLQCHTDAKGTWSRPYYHMYYATGQMSRLLRQVQRDSGDHAIRQKSAKVI